MLGNDAVDEELQRGFGLSIKEIEPLLRAGGDAASRPPYIGATAPHKGNDDEPYFHH
jgi:hypothetical protein